ncbi:MAG: SpoIIE family protein phosphatase [Crocinitomicaceae bacterium]
MIRLFFTAILILCCTFYGQSKTDKSEIDSLKIIVSSDAADSSIIKAYHFLAHHYSNFDSTWSYDSALYFIDRSIEIMKKSGLEDMTSYPYVRKFQLFQDLHEYEKALDEILKYLELSQKYNKINWEADALSEIMGLFDFLKDSIRSEEYAKKLIDLIDQMDSKKLKADCYNYLGTHYKEINLTDKALEYHNKSLELRIENGNRKGAAYSYNNIGIVYKNIGRYDEALKYYFKSLEIKEDLKDTRGCSGSNINIANVMLLSKKFSEGIPFVNKGIALAKESNADNFLLVGYEVLYELEKGRGNFKSALEALENHIELDAVVHDQEVAKQAKELERKYEAEKRLHELKILKQKQEINDLELDKQEKDIEQQRNIIIFFIVGSILFGVLVVFLVINRNQKSRMNLVLQQQNAEIQIQKEETELQKSIVEQKNKEITDSIAYAKKIQSAILPPKSKIDALLNEYFVLYLPKDIVAGDFYWVETLNHVTYVAVADCTGHGVPGALVSVVCSNMLSKTLVEEKIHEPGKILDRTRELVIEYFERGEELIKDGMDISLLAIHKGNENEIERIEFSGANSSILIVEPGMDGDEMIEVKGDKQPVGKYKDSHPFTNQRIEPVKGAMIYLFTDGFQDQFGGEHKGGKKLKSKNFHRLLHSYHQFHVSEQPEKLKAALYKWQGDLEQVDDICVIGIKIK